MNRKIKLLVVFGLLAMLTLGCSVCGQITSGGGTRGSGNVTLVNQSGSTVCYVYISPVTDDYWGQDLLGSTETIANGASRAFDVPPGNYDLRADDCSRNQLSVVWDASISGSYTWNVR